MAQFPWEIVLICQYC